MIYRLRWLFFAVAIFCTWLWTMNYSTEVWQSTEQRDCATGLFHTWHGWAVLGLTFVLLTGAAFSFEHDRSRRPGFV